MQTATEHHIFWHSPVLVMDKWPGLQQLCGMGCLSYFFCCSSTVLSTSTKRKQRKSECMTLVALFSCGTWKAKTLIRSCVGFRVIPALAVVWLQFNLQTISYRTVLLNKFTYMYRWYLLCEGESAESSGFFSFCSENAVLGLHISWYQIILNSHRYLNA